MNKTLVAIALSAAAFTASARYHAPYEYPRVLWDISSQQTLMGGGYPRLIPLQDGRLIAAAESGGIKVVYSNDNGDHWGSPPAHSRKPFESEQLCARPHTAHRRHHCGGI